MPNSAVSHDASVSATAAVIPNTFVIERSYSAAPARVFSAFADPATKRRWYAEGKSHEVEAFEMDFRVGGRETTRYRFGEGTPFPGAELTTDGIFHDIVPDRRVVIASSMSLAGRRISVTLVTIEMEAAEQGTRVTLTHQGIFLEGADGPTMREGGWRKLMESLERELAR